MSNNKKKDTELRSSDGTKNKWGLKGNKSKKISKKVQPGGATSLHDKNRKKSPNNTRKYRMVATVCVIALLVVVLAITTGGSTACDPEEVNSCGPRAVCDSTSFKCTECPRHQVASQNARQCVTACPAQHTLSEDGSKCILAPCGPGFKKSWDGTVCLRDPCHEADCGIASRCVRLTDTTYECRCEIGRSGKKPGATRSDICHDPCAEADCGVAGQCVPLTGTTYECRCEEGVSVKNPGASLSDICREPCETGYTRSEEGAACDVCATGYTASSTDGSFDCDACATGYVRSEGGSVCILVPCETGYTRSEKWSPCDICYTPGYFRADDGSTCIPVCKPGYTRSEASSYECDVCETEYMRSEDGSECIPVPCETGYIRLQPGSGCDYCASGYTPWSKQDGTTVCVPVCETGYIRSVAGSGGCVPVCETGYARSGEAGSDECDVCDTGYMRSEGGSVCIPDPHCESGTLMATHKIGGEVGGMGMNLDQGGLFGFAVASVGDLNGDGTIDLAVGAPRQKDVGVTGASSGAANIMFLNPDYTIKNEQKIGRNELNVMVGGLVGPVETSDEFGYSLANIGDLDGDGVEDLVVGAIGDDDGGQDKGALYVLFLSQTGDVVKKEQKISLTQGGLSIPLENNDQLGAGVARIGDVNQDGVVDMAVAVVAGSDPGKTVTFSDKSATLKTYILFLNSDGTVNDDQWVRNTAGSVQHFGMAGIGDLDGDGLLDLAVGNPGDTDGGKFHHGSVFILFLKKDGTVDRTQKIGPSDGGLGELDTHARFGAVANIGDLDGDGVIDLAVGAGGTKVGARAWFGAVHVLLLNRDGTVKGRQDISGSPGGGMEGEVEYGDNFGNSVAILGVQEGGKMIDLVVGGAWNDNNHAVNAGAAYVLEVPKGFVDGCKDTSGG